MENKITNKYGYNVVVPKRARLAVKGTSCKIGDTVYPIAKFNTSNSPEMGTPLVVKLMWKNKYATVLEFEGTEFSAASTLFAK